MHLVSPKSFAAFFIKENLLLWRWQSKNCFFFFNFKIVTVSSIYSCPLLVLAPVVYARYHLSLDSFTIMKTVNIANAIVRIVST